MGLTSRRLEKELVAKNIAYLYVIQLLRLCLPLAMLSILTKTLSGPQYSVYVYTLASAIWLSTFVEYGFNVSATRRIAATTDAHTIREVILQTQAARWLLAGLTLPFLAWAMLASAVFSPHPEWAVCAWLLGVMTGLTPTYYYQALSKLSGVALLEVGGGLLTVAAVLLMVHGPKDFWRLCVVLVAVRLVILRVLDRQMFSDHQLLYHETIKTRPGLFALKNGWKIFLVSIAASLYTSFNIVLLGGVSTTYAVAVYGSSERLIRAGLAFIGQATAAIFPKLTAMKAGDPLRLRRARRLSLLAFSAGSIACLPLIWWLAPSISDALFHNALPDITTVLRIMVLVVPAIAVSNVLAFHFLVVDNQEHILNWVVFCAVPVSLSAGYLLSRKHGAVGMAAAWVTVEWLVSLALAAVIFHRYKRSH